MVAIRAETLPEDALLTRYQDSGAYTDCFVTEVDRPVVHAEYVRAFYTSWLFKIERFILTWVVQKPSSDGQAAILTLDHVQGFAAWHVEARTADQLLMCDYQSRTRSWLRTVAIDSDRHTRLYFGSAVVPVRPNGEKDRAFGLAFHLLLGFHKIYARALLRAAVRNLRS